MKLAALATIYGLEAIETARASEQSGDWVAALAPVSMAGDLQLLRPYRSPLQGAAEAGRLDIVKLLQSFDADGVNDPAIPLYGRTALQAAARNGHDEVVANLVSSSADVPASPAVPFGRTALQAAAEGGYSTTVKLLINQYASPDEPAAAMTDLCPLFRRWLDARIEETTGYPVLYIPTRILHTAHVGGTALKAAARNGHERVVKTPIDVGVDLNMSAHGTASQAAAAALLPIAKALVDAGADINSVADKCCGRTAPQTAAEAGQMDIVRHLLQHMADVESAAAAFHDRTALMAAAEQGHISIV